MLRGNCVGCPYPRPRVPSKLQSICARAERERESTSGCSPVGGSRTRGHAKARLRVPVTEFRRGASGRGISQALPVRRRFCPPGIVAPAPVPPPSDSKPAASSSSRFLRPVPARSPPSSRSPAATPAPSPSPPSPSPSPSALCSRARVRQKQR